MSLSSTEYFYYRYTEAHPDTLLQLYHLILSAFRSSVRMPWP